MSIVSNQFGEVADVEGTFDNTNIR